jgi:hypothetical protein
MARMRKFIKRPLLEECVDILRARFPKADITLSEHECGRYKHCFTLDVSTDEGTRFDLMDCLSWLGFTYGNVGYSVGPK